MDNFVYNKLDEWELNDYIQNFQAGKINETSLYCLDHEEIKELIPEPGPRSIFKHRLKILKALKACQSAIGEESSPVKQQKRKSDHQGEGSKDPIPGKRHHESLGSETEIMKKVKETMENVEARIANCTEEEASKEWKDFLLDKIRGLETDKRELVGVFGRTGAGKSSLINAVIGQDILPSGEVTSCTTVMIKVEARMDGKDKFSAEIEFIEPGEWEHEFWPFQEQVKQNADKDIIEKVSAVYGKKWKLVERPMDSKHFRKIPEFLKSEIKTLTSGTAKELSEKLVKYTRNDLTQDEDPDAQAYWPLVKCVTIRVPNNNFLQHVTLMDLPGNGDSNKSRDKMWRGIVGNCSTVWIVTEIKRAASEKETWEILDEVCSLIGNGGECCHICFICTHSDQFKQMTKKAKTEVKNQFNETEKIRKHFSEESFEVFTVSSKEQSPENEIPKLQEFLKELNDCHSETENYVSGAHGILSLIQGARLREADGVKADVYKILEKTIKSQLAEVERKAEMAYNSFGEKLCRGVEISKTSWETRFESEKKRTINNMTWRSIVENGGIHRTGKGKQFNLNIELASFLLDSIDDKFRETFPNEGKSGPFYGVINKFSLMSDKRISDYQALELHLIFLKTEEEKVKKELIKIIRDRKKKIYNSLAKKIKEVMQEGYNEAAQHKGVGTVPKMIKTIETHVKKSEDMFEQAKEAMLKELKHLKKDILEKLRNTMMQSTKQSLKTGDHSLPDVSEDLETVKKLYDELKCSFAG